MLFDFRLVLSRYILAQARRKFGELFPAYVEEFEELLASLHFEEAEDPKPEEVRDNLNLMRDYTDIPAALAAINARVDYFVTDDKDFTAPNQPIHDKLHILQSGTFLNEVLGLTHEELDRVKRRTWMDVAGIE